MEVKFLKIDLQRYMDPSYKNFRSTPRNLRTSLVHSKANAKKVVIIIKAINKCESSEHFPCLYIFV